jgi:hypothetical protein
MAKDPPRSFDSRPNGVRSGNETATGLCHAGLPSRPKAMAACLADTMRVVASKQTNNGRSERLSPKELAELMRPATAKTLEEKRAAVAQATQGLRVKVRVTPSMYGRR